MLLHQRRNDHHQTVQSDNDTAQQYMSSGMRYWRIPILHLRLFNLPIAPSGFRWLMHRLGHRQMLLQRFQRSHYYYDAFRYYL